MLIDDIVQTDLVTVEPRATLTHVLHVLNRKGVRHVPVVEDGRLVGIISDRDIKSALALSLGPDGPDSYRTAGQIMTRDPITIAPMFPVEEAARVMLANRISALPVVDGTRLIGIVTETDLLRLLSRAMGALEPSSRLDIVAPDRVSAVDEVIRTIEATGVKISSVMTWAAPAGGRPIIVTRVATIDPGPAIRALQAKGYVVRDSWRAPQTPAGAERLTSPRES
jgi:acetoin utilization protein AcuB